MSDQVPSQGISRPVVDGSNLINTGGGGGGVASLNGDTTAAQILNPAAGSPIRVNNMGGGNHTLGALPFSPGQAGIVSDPGAHAATDYLGADNTFRAIPGGGGGLTSVTGDFGGAVTGPAMTLKAMVNGGSGPAAGFNVQGISGTAAVLNINTPILLHTDGVPLHIGVVSVPNAVPTVQGTYTALRSGLAIVSFSYSAGAGFSALGSGFASVDGPGGLIGLGYDGFTITTGGPVGGTITVIQNVNVGDVFTCNFFQSTGAPQNVAFYMTGTVI
jgi:hypothetical protein